MVFYEFCRSVYWKQEHSAKKNKVEYILIVASYFVQLRCFLFLKKNIEKDLLYYCKSREKKNAVRKNICYSDSIEKLKGEQKEIEKMWDREEEIWQKSEKSQLYLFIQLL